MIRGAQLVSDLWANVQFRLEGSTDERPRSCASGSSDAIAGCAVWTCSGWARTCSAAAAPLYPEVLREA